MTKKLFLNDSYKTEFKANVLECFKIKKNFAVILDKTYFYPEAGGQPADLGEIGTSEVIDVYYYKENIIHLVNKKVAKKEVNCKINKERRVSFMQQHLGQHILSRSLERLYDINTVGFHIGDDYVTIDTDKKLGISEIEKAEEYSNNIVFNNLKVKTLYPTKAELEKMPLRKMPSVTENIRIINIDGFDFSPCGGTHLKFTSEVGIIKVKKIKSNKNGLRIEFVCGKWAYNDYKWKNNYINELSDILTIKDTEVKDTVIRLNDELLEAKKDIGVLKEKLIDLEIETIINNYQEIDNKKIIEVELENKSIKDLRNIGAKIVSNDDFVIALYSNVGKKTNFVAGKSKNIEYDIRSYFEKVLSKINGKGGGNNYLLQGSGSEKITKGMLNFNF